MEHIYLLLVPFVVLIIVLLFGFVGCAKFTTSDITTSTGVDYPSTIKAEASLVAYWRLGEPATTAIAPPKPGGIAAEEQGKYPGNYARYSPAPSTDKLHHSYSNGAVINLGQTPGLLEYAPSATCIDVNGGMVNIPFNADLNPPNFTLEAWVVAEFDGDPLGNFYCLFENGAPDIGKQKTEGFGLYAGPADLTNLNTPYEWQVWMGDGTTFAKVPNTLPTPAAVVFQKVTYLALTFDGTNLVLVLYYPGTGQDLTDASVVPLRAAFPTFKPATSGTFVIGSGRNLVAASPDPNPLYAFRGKIQEVALYKQALTIQDHLVGHEQSGAGF
jgi:Concanavalin A-like lectin/glucanases superfamily